MSCLELGYMKCLTSRHVTFNETEMASKKTDDIGRSTQVYVEELEQESILIEVEHLNAELHNVDEVEKEVQDAEEIEKTINDYLLARDRSRRVIKPLHRLGYEDFIAFSLIYAS